AGGTPHRPVLSLVDVDTGVRTAPGRWSAEVLVREHVDGGAVGLLARAGTVLSRPLTGAEATVVSAALGLGAAAGASVRSGTGWLAVIGRGQVRWVAAAAAAGPAGPTTAAGPPAGTGRRPGDLPRMSGGSAAPADVGRSPAWVSSSGWRRPRWHCGSPSCSSPGSG